MGGIAPPGLAICGLLESIAHTVGGDVEEITHNLDKRQVVEMQDELVCYRVSVLQQVLVHLLRRILDEGFDDCWKQAQMSTSLQRREPILPICCRVEYDTEHRIQLTCIAE